MIGVALLASSARGESCIRRYSKFASSTRLHPYVYSRIRINTRLSLCFLCLAFSAFYATPRELTAILRVCEHSQETAIGKCTVRQYTERVFDVRSLFEKKRAAWVAVE